MREVSLDTETTGFDPAGGHRIVEIGAVELVDGLPSGRTFHAYVNPERSVPREAFQVHGLSDRFLADKPVFSQVVAELLDFLAGDRLVIHNAEFDLRFLNHELGRLGFPKLANPIVDTLVEARKRFPGKQTTLDALCRRFGVDLSKREKHGALLDAQLLGEVWLQMNGGRERRLELDVKPAAPERPAFAASSLPLRPSRGAVAPSAAEIAAHRAFIAAHVKGAVWDVVLAPLAEAEAA